MPIMPIPLPSASPLQGLGERVHIARRRRRLSQGALVAQLSPRISRNSLSEIENGKGAARIHPQEFERIVAAYEGEPYRKQFGIWAARAHKPEPTLRDTSFAGAVLKFLRKKAKMPVSILNT